MFNERLRELRKSAGLSQSELAAKLDMAQNSLSNWERGERKPDVEVMARIADFFEVSTDYLLGKTDIKKTVSSNDLADTDAGVLLDTLLDKLKAEDTIMFNGFVLSRDTAEKLAASLAATDALAEKLLEEKKKEKG